MRPIVFFSFPAYGHVNPTLPVVAELVGRGEQVVYFATSAFRTAVEACGARWLPYPESIEMREDGPGPFDRITTTVEALLRMSGAVLDEQLDQVKALGPPIIVHDSFSPWGKFMAQRLGIPAVVSVPSILVNQEIVSSYGANPESDAGLTREWFERIDLLCSAFAERHGVTRLAPDQWLQVYGDLNLVYTSRLFQPRAELFDPDRFRFVGPSIGRRHDAPAFPFELLGREPLVYISLGTVYGARARFFPMCIEALRNSPGGS
jgi:MGT family glycosyltransferase